MTETKKNVIPVSLTIDYDDMKCHLRISQTSSISDPFFIFQQGDLSKGILLDIIMGSIMDYFREKGIQINWTDNTLHTCVQKGDNRQLATDDI